MAALVALFFLANVGMVFRTFADFVASAVPLPRWVLGVAFAIYSLAVALGVRRLFMSERPLLSARATKYFLFTCVLGLVALTVFIPTAQDMKADRDDALDIAGRALLAGDDPWLSTTQLGNHISPLLGGVLLALPFVALVGSSAFQSCFWLALGSWLSATRIGVLQAGAIVAVAFASPVMLNEFVFQSDLWVNALVLAVAFLWAYVAVRRPSPGFHLVGSSLLAACGLTDRYIFLTLMIPAFFLLAKVGARRLVLTWLGLSSLFVGVLISITLLRFPGSVASIEANLAKSASATVPHSGVILVIATLVLATVLTYRAKSVSDYFWTMCLTVAVIPVWETVKFALDRAPDTFSNYNVVAYSAGFLVFGLIALVVPNAPLVPHGSRERELLAADPEPEASGPRHDESVRFQPPRPDSEIRASVPTDKSRGAT
jgi:hypothetical protein